MFLDFNAMLAQETQANPSKTLRTYVDVKGVKHTVEHYSNDMFALVREDGYVTIPPCASLIMILSLVDAHGLVEEGQIVVAQAQAVVALDDEIKALEEKLAQVKAEKQALVDAVEVKTGVMHINGFRVDVKVGTRGLTSIAVTQKISTAASIGFNVFLHSTVGKPKYLKLLCQIKRATSMQNLIDTIDANREKSESEIAWFVSLHHASTGILVSMHADHVYVDGYGLECRYDNPINIYSLARASQWMTDNLLGMYEDLIDCETSKQDVYDLCEQALACGCTEPPEEDGYEFSEDDAWKRWE